MAFYGILWDITDITNNLYRGWNHQPAIPANLEKQWIASGRFGTDERHRVATGHAGCAAGLLAHHFGEHRLASDFFWRFLGHVGLSENVGYIPNDS